MNHYLSPRNGNSPAMVFCKWVHCLFAVFTGLLIGGHVMAQPVVSSLSAYSGVPGASVTISGSGFNTTAGNNVVYFGPTRATVTSASTTSLTVNVPGGATHEPVSVTNLSTGLYGASKYPFLPTFSNPYTPALNMGSHADFVSTYQPYKIKSADMDGDGKPDLVVETNGAYYGIVGYTNTVAIYRNVSDDIVSSSSFAFCCSLALIVDTPISDIAVADIDGDGKKDIVLARPSGIAVIRNNATAGSITSSSFDSPVPFYGISGVSDGNRTIAVGDIDGDGRVDVVTAKDYSAIYGATGELAVFRNTATSGSITSGSFASPVALSGYAGFPICIELADVDGDGKVDILAGEYGVTVMRNIATSGSITSSSFSSPVVFTTSGGLTRSIATGDIDGDGKPDVVVGDAGAVSILRNTSTSGSINSGSLSTHVDFAVGGSSAGVALGDLTGDGKLDVAFTFDSSHCRLGVLVNTATSGTITAASFAPRQTYYTAIAYALGDNVAPGSPLIVDINGDGRPDVLHANGDQSFAAIQNQVPPPMVTAVSSSIAIPGTSVTLTGTNFNATAANNKVYFGATKAVVTAASSSSLTVTVPTGATHEPISVTNTAIAERGSSRSLFLQTYDHSAFPSGALGFNDQVDIPNGTAIYAPPVVKDLDGDGKPDVFSSNKFFRNVSTPGSISAASFVSAAAPPSLSSSGLFTRFEDIDGDGKPDMIVMTGDSLKIRRNISSVGTLDASSFSAPVSIVHSLINHDGNLDLEIGDLDGDGKPDLVLGKDASPHESYVVVIRNSCTPGNISSGNFEPALVELGPYGTTGETYELTLCDFNNDGLLDMVVGVSGYTFGGGIFVLQNKAQRGFICKHNEYTGSLPSVYFNSFEDGIPLGLGDVPAAADIDGDGKPDLLSLDLTEHKLRVMRNTSSTSTVSFASPVSFVVSEGYAYYNVKIGTGDLDGDGKVDIVLAGSNSLITVLRNTAISGTIDSSSLSANIEFPVDLVNEYPTNIPTVVDIDGDNRPDIVFGNNDAAKWSVLWNNPLAINGDKTICVGSSNTLHDAATGGTWSSSDSSVASIGSATGVATGVAAGTVVVTYHFSGGGTATTVVTVNITPAPITGPASVCTGANAALTDSTPSGGWFSSNSNAAINESSGVMHGNTVGTSIITYMLYPTGCQVTKAVTVNLAPTAIIGTVNVCVGSTATLSDTTAGGTWTSSASSVAAVGTSGVVTGVAPGTAVVSYTLSSGCSATRIATVGPIVAAIGGDSSVCNGSNLYLPDVTTGGTWTSSDASVATIIATGTSSGVAMCTVSGTSTGTAMISYSVTSACGVAVATKIVTVNAGIAAITGTASVCVGGTTSLADATAGGTWWSAITSKATVDSTSGIVTGVNAGTVTIVYTKNYAGGGSCSATKIVTVNAVPSAISGAHTVNVGSTLSLSHSGTGTWSSSDASVASISTSGVVSGVSTGVATITWTSGCFVTHTVTVSMPTITGSFSISGGGTTMLSNSVPGGAWSTTCGNVATVSSAGEVTGVSNGLATITYTVGTATTTAVVTVSTSSSAITGSLNVCEGATTTIGHPVAGGAWTSGGSDATITGGGVVSGVAQGTAPITYTYGPGCGSIATTTINPLPAAITGGVGICIGGTMMLADSTPGGTWSSSMPGVAVVNSTTGAVTGVSLGGAILNYTLPTGCSAQRLVSITLGAGVISGTTDVCPGTTTTLTSSLPGGSWSSSATSVATVNSAGLVSGVTSGTATITYSIGSCLSPQTVTVNGTPSAGLLTGSSSVAIGATITLSATASGGTWAASNGHATVSTSGVVTGVTAGSVTIVYAVTNGCGTATTTKVVNVGVVVDGITGTLTVCPGGITILSNATGGGEWSSSNTSIAVISTGGIVTGVTAGTCTMSYTTALGYATAVVTVNSAPSSFSGSFSVCVGGITTLNNSATGGGIWSSSNTSVATVGSGTGFVSGLSAGTTTISYTSGTGCTGTVEVTVNALPGFISGVAGVCSGSTTVLSCAGEGSWSSSTTAVASIGETSGVVTGVGSGMTTITYTLGTGCRATTTVTVYALPASITGSTSVCEGSTTNLYTSASGGSWSSDNAAIATVGASGLVSGVHAGTVAISYTSGPGCVRSTTVTVNAIPTITGTAYLCPGTTTTLGGDAAGGTWSGGSTTVATVGSSGIVTGIATGATNVTYTISSGCRSSITVTVGTAPAAITGTMKACPGTSTTLSSMTAGGTWSTSDATLATADAATGIITGVAAGLVTTTYTTGAGCYRTTTVTINPLPAAIAGTLTTCVGSSTSLTDATSGLSWSSSNTSVATISTTGVVTGVSAGNTTITYTAASTNCIATAVVTVNGVPATIGGPAIGCTGISITLTNSVPGGAWSSSNTAVATVDPATGVVAGVASGMATITYVTGLGCYKTKAITINTSPTVTGYPIVCTGLTTTLSGGSSGTWASSTPAVASVTTSGGYVSGVSAGTSTMTFTATSTTCPATYVVTVIPVPAAITGPSMACQGATATLSNSTPGGAWSSSNAAVASVGSATGVVTAVGSGGTATISYSFGNCRVTTSFTPKPLPAAITGTASVCSPMTTTLGEATSGGAWTSGNTSIATVGSGASATQGIVTGIAGGTANITYTVTSTGCARSTVVTVNAGLDPGTITSSSGFTLHTVSAPTSVTLSTSGATGGLWATSNAGVAMISTSGVVTAVAAGTTTITYAVTTSCTNLTTRVITVTAGKPTEQKSSVGSVQLYPNPTTGAFTLVSEEAGTLNVFSMDGKEITSYSINAGINPLNLPREIAAGVYMCRYTSESGSTTMVRLVVE